MTFTGSAQLVGMIGGMASAYLSGRANKKAIEAQNRSNQAAWDASAQVLRDQLSVAYNRTQIGVAEVNRDRLASKLAIRRAQHKTVGTKNVQAAQLGISGRRGQGLLTQEVNRAAADAISDTDIGAEVQMTNVVNAFNDSARTAVANLNAHAPSAQQVPSTANLLINTLGTGVKYYSTLSKNQQTDLLNNFNFKSDPAADVAPANLMDWGR